MTWIDKLTSLFTEPTGSETIDISSVEPWLRTQSVGDATINRVMKLLKRHKELEHHHVKAHQECEKYNARFIQLKDKAEAKQRILETYREDPLHLIVQQHTEQQDALRFERTKVLGEIKKTMDPLTSHFAQYHILQPMDPKIKGYQEDPVHSFIKDDTLSILHYLQHMHAIARAGKLDDPSGHLTTITPSQLTSLQNQYNTLAQTTSRKLDGDAQVFLHKVQETEYKLDHFMDRLKRVQEQKRDAEEHCAARKTQLEQHVVLLQDTLTRIAGKPIMLDF